LLAGLLNPIHANISNPRLWECEGEIGKRDGQLKCGCHTLTTVREISISAITMEQYVRFAIGCTWMSASAEWRTWASGWLTGIDRTAEAAYAANTVAYVAYVVAAVAEANAREGIDLAKIAEWAITDAPISTLWP
jgi:hypothetical protein